MKQAREDGIREYDIILELARFGATYALMPRTDNDPIAVAKQSELQVLAEPDEEEDDDDPR